MAFRFSSGGVVALVAMLSFAGCGPDTSQPPASQAPAEATRAERDLAQQANAFQKTVVQGIAVGVAVGLIGGKGPKNGLGLWATVPVGTFGGTYVAFLQRRYANKERRLKKARDDIRTANKELEAAIATMRVVLAQQRSELAAIRQTPGASAALSGELREAQINLANMERAIDGADGWREEFSSARSVIQAEGQVNGIDPQIAALTRRIATMRSIADSLAEEI